MSWDKSPIKKQLEIIKGLIEARALEQGAPPELVDAFPKNFFTVLPILYNVVKQIAL